MNLHNKFLLYGGMAAGGTVSKFSHFLVFWAHVLPTGVCVCVWRGGEGEEGRRGRREFSSKCPATAFRVVPFSSPRMLT